MDSDVIVVGKPITGASTPAPFFNYFSGILVSEFLGEKKGCGFTETSGLIDHNGLFAVDGEHDCEAFYLKEKNTFDGESQRAMLSLVGVEFCIFGKLSKTSDLEIEAFHKKNPYRQRIDIDSKNVLKPTELRFTTFPALERKQFLSSLVKKEHYFTHSEKTISQFYTAFDQNFNELAPPDIINCVKIISKALAQSDQVKIRESLELIADSHKIELVTGTAKHLLEHEGDFPVYVSKPKE